MNTSIFSSKKFQAAIISVIAGLISIVSTRLGLGYDIGTCVTIAGTVMTPFLIYIGAEGYSEQSAKAVVEENKSRKLISDQLISSIVNKPTDPPSIN